MLHLGVRLLGTLSSIQNKATMFLSISIYDESAVFIENGHCIKPVSQILLAAEYRQIFFITPKGCLYFVFKLWIG